MTNWHLINTGRSETGQGEDYDMASGWMIQITTGASNSKTTSWSEIVTSTPSDWYGFSLYLVQYQAQKSYMYDLAIGSSGNEVALIEEVPMTDVYATTQYRISSNIQFFPFFIPSGSRLSTKGRSSYSIEETGLNGWLIGHKDNPFVTPMFGKSEYKGINTSNSNCYSIDPGATANTWGSWSDVNGTPMGIDAKWVMITATNGGDISRGTCTWTIQLGVGSSGNEYPILTFVLTCHGSANILGPIVQYFTVNIPSGTTIRHRAKCTINTSGDRLANIGYHFYE